MVAMLAVRRGGLEVMVFCWRVRNGVGGVLKGCLESVESVLVCVEEMPRWVGFLVLTENNRSECLFTTV